MSYVSHSRHTREGVRTKFHVQRRGARFQFGEQSSRFLEWMIEERIKNTKSLEIPDDGEGHVSVKQNVEMVMSASLSTSTLCSNQIGRNNCTIMTK